MAFSADEFIGKTATAKAPLKLDFYVNGVPIGAKVYKAGDQIGKIFSWTGQGDALMFIVDTDLNMQPGTVHVHPSEMQGTELEDEVKGDRKKEAEKKAQEKEDNKSTTDKLIDAGKKMMKWIIGAVAAYLLGRWVLDKVFASKE